MKRFVMFAVCMILGVTMAACAGAGGFSNEKIRYKMTVTVETPEGIKTGSAVREAGRYTEPSILPDQGGTMYNITKGEAVVVDLGQRGVLFALLGGEDEARTVFKSLASKSDQIMESVELTIAQYPKLVSFKDRNAPETIELVLETEPCADTTTGIPRNATCVKKDRVLEIYGEGVRLKTIMVEKTDDEVQFGVVKGYLKWFREPGYSLGLKFFDPANPEPAKYLISDDFQTRNN
ncbi:MAG: hypothetical protein H3C49_06560 [Alphaproteobacteria bacterium]|nr:hypothetical protein [Alphaproteobacteria bacterium]